MANGIFRASLLALIVASNAGPAQAQDDTLGGDEAVVEYDGGPFPSWKVIRAVPPSGTKRIQRCIASIPDRMNSEAMLEFVASKTHFQIIYSHKAWNLAQGERAAELTIGKKKYSMSMTTGDNFLMYVAKASKKDAAIIADLGKSDEMSLSAGDIRGNFSYDDAGKAMSAMAACRKNIR